MNKLLGYFLILVGFLINVHSVFAQESGYVILKDGTKISRINLSITFTEYSLSVLNDAGRRDTFNAAAIHSFKTMDGSFYKSVLWNPDKKQYKLINCLHDGWIQMYHYRDSIWLKDSIGKPQSLYLRNNILSDKEEEKVRRILYYYTNSCPRLRKFIADISIRESKIREVLVRYEECLKSGNTELPDPLPSEGMRLGFQIAGQLVKPSLEKGGTVLSAIAYQYQPQAGLGFRFSKNIAYHSLFVTGIDFYQRSFKGDGSVAGVIVTTDFKRFDLELPLQIQYYFHPDSKHTPLLSGGLKVGYSIIMNNKLLVKSGSLIIENEPVSTSRISIGGGVGAGWLYKLNKQWEIQADYFFNSSFMLNKTNGFSFRLPGHQLQLSMWYHFKQ